MVLMSDHGGHAKERGYPIISRVSVKNGAISLKCRSCGKHRYAARRELNRAKQPRCLGCGGSCEETDATRKRNGTTDDDMMRIDKIRERNKTNECWICSKRFRSSVAMDLHIEETHGEDQQESDL